MNEIQAILEAGSEFRRGGPVVLATVVRVKGSAYRRPGARMLLRPDGRSIGTVSGGCLEGDVKFRAWRLTARGEPAVVRYDSTAEGEVVWQLGLGCKGVVDVLIERLDPGRGSPPLDFLRNSLDNRRSGVLARVVAVEGDAGAHLGAFLTLDEDGHSDDDFAGCEAAVLVRQNAAAALVAGRSQYVACELPAGRLELFLELVEPPLSLLVCGAGHDAIPLVRLAKELGWHVTVLDPRPTYATRERFPLADEILVADPEQLAARDNHSQLRSLLPSASELTGRLASLARGAAVIMSHHYSNDLLFLRALLPAPLRYLGVLGPRSRTESLLSDLAASGFRPTDRQRERLHGPVGLDIGADTPEEIAVAIAAEIRAVLAGRSGQPLRRRDSTIHDRLLDEDQPLAPVRTKGERVCLAETHG